MILAMRGLNQSLAIKRKMCHWNCTPGLCTDVVAEFGIFENIPGRTGKYCQIWLVFSHVDNSFNAKPFTIPLKHYVTALYSVLADLEIFFAAVSYQL